MHTCQVEKLRAKLIVNLLDAYLERKQMNKSG